MGMSREEAIEYLTILGGIGGITDNEAMALEIAIEALEQEPVIDKIRAEIEQTRKMYLDMNDIDWLNGCDYVLSVVDKYRGENEPQESEEKK